MSQFEPKEYIPITKQITDPLETSTLYVRAYMRNAKTDVLLDTIDLTDKGDQRFRGEVEAPHDPTGNGVYITITTQVFEDSGYTSASSIYPINEESHLIQTRPTINLGGGGADVNYDKVRRIIKEEIDKIPEVEIPRHEIVDISPLLKEIKSVKADINNISIPEMPKIPEFPKIPKQEKVDLQPILNKLKDLESSVIKTIGNIPKSKETDLKPLLKSVKSLKNNIKDSMEFNLVVNGKKTESDKEEEEEKPVQLVNFKKYLTKK